WLASIVESNPGLIVLETALKDRKVIVRGWVRSLSIDVLDVADDLDGLPLAGLLVSSPHIEGGRSATDLNLLEDLAEACEFPILASGVVETLSDLRALEHRGVAGVVMPAGLFTGEVEARWVAREFSE